eukprot:CAMPEP_0116080780 /NCGR_PEP_ID=MMETSP0327-20121206/1858_1 /TAXON_ID=44447 /ORGANISM="Pseudo-nitzschia delicatissima, Strain B596" /LENGTH=287 /DNA_ID=CAMNT_0003571495 /DNA_START=214 /DNA_END=1077 /DNA_ORIENTATION=+
MPDVTSMKAKDMRQELESYGIKTHNFFDKREFEQALIEARRNYEQTLNDVMSSTRPKEKKTQARRKTVNYDRSQHRDERIYSSDVNDQPGQGTRYAEEQFHRQQTKQRRRTHYQAEPNPVGNFQRDFETYPNVNTGPQGGGGRRRPGNDWFEQDPLYDHEKQANGRDEHFARGREEHFEEEYTVGGNREPRVTYDDPAKEMKYQAALQYAYNMKVEDLQRELNCRGISTKYCMIVKDFCIEYAKAVVEGKEKNVEDPDENTFGEDDEDYDPAYRDVVMQKYDPSMWI